ncbi:MAG: hypothetical protein QXU61_04760, partial [Archaeoglobaceae archaeon]
MKKISSLIVTFILSLLLWLIFSAWNVYIVGYYELSRFLSGVIVALIVTFTMHELLKSERFKLLGKILIRFVFYSIWQLYQIFLAT